MGTPSAKSSLLELDQRTKKRNAAEARFRAYGIAAIAVGLVFLVVLISSIIFKGVGAFQQSFITLDVELHPGKQAGQVPASATSRRSRKSRPLDITR